MLDTISAKELDWYAEDGRALLIDLRPRMEYKQGHIEGAVNVPHGNFQNFRLEKNRPMILYCDRGSLSMAVARELADRGYRVKSVVGGFHAYRGRRVVAG